jgi:hypothetical protein
MSRSLLYCLVDAALIARPTQKDDYGDLGPEVAIKTHRNLNDPETPRGVLDDEQARLVAQLAGIVLTTAPLVELHCELSIARGYEDEEGESFTMEVALWEHADPDAWKGVAVQLAEKVFRLMRQRLEAEGGAG